MKANSLRSLRWTLCALAIVAGVGAHRIVSATEGEGAAATEGTGAGATFRSQVVGVGEDSICPQQDMAFAPGARARGDGPTDDQLRPLVEQAERNLGGARSAQ